MTAEEFAEAYARRCRDAGHQDVTVEWLRAHGREPRPCYCNYEGCEGWQMVNVKDWDEDYDEFGNPKFRS